ncbi:hypothetical protein HYC85_002652 [Camellia sinensis]|uniref:Uncharacterized protein n=1 Tax=Camellia sinensis TaxID=4442 RepID=A0A7J7I8W1_CAMSI|nr:hypothetical protein HYC85_002652 [Camellia sinensis]
MVRSKFLTGGDSKAEKMKEIAKLKAKEEKRILESELKQRVKFSGALSVAKVSRTVLVARIVAMFGAFIRVYLVCGEDQLELGRLQFLSNIDLIVDVAPFFGNHSVIRSMSPFRTEELRASTVQASSADGDSQISYTLILPPTGSLRNPRAQ